MAGKGEEIGEIVEGGEMIVGDSAKPVHIIACVRPADLCEDVLVEPAFAAGDDEMVGEVRPFASFDKRPDQAIEIFAGFEGAE